MASVISAGTTSNTSLNLSGDTSGVLQLASNGSTTAVTIDTSQNVGIGTSSPQASLHVAGAISNAPTGSGVLAGIQSDYAVIHLNGSASTGSIIDFSQSGSDNLGRILYDNTSNYMFFATNTAERMRIDSSGRLLVGSTVTTSGGNTISPGGINITASANFGMGINMPAGNQFAVVFANGGISVGSISVTGSATAYNTSSDYRLKENIAPMTGALATVTQLKPVTYKWKVDGSDGQGFIAHELQEIVPEAVAGEKDAVDADGNIKPQGIDTSFLVATLTAAIQELKAELDATKAEVQALKGTL